MRSFMVRYEGSFIGFLTEVSGVLKTLGDEWLSEGFLKQDKEANAWGKVFTSASHKIAEIVVDLTRIRNEYDAREARIEAAKTITST